MSISGKEEADLARALTVSRGAATYRCCAIVAVLAEEGLVDPLKVAEWADLFAASQGNDLALEIRDGIAAEVRGFADLLRSMTLKPSDAHGNARATLN